MMYGFFFSVLKRPFCACKFNRFFVSFFCFSIQRDDVYFCSKYCHMNCYRFDLVHEYIERINSRAGEAFNGQNTGDKLGGSVESVSHYA